MGGEHDVVKAALSKLGTVTFRKVAMQPGMPQGFGTLGPDHTPLFTLPGNPVSAYVSFLLFAAPALRKLQGLPAQRPRVLTAALTAAVRSPEGRRSYLRGVLDDARADGRPADWPVLAPAGRAGPGERADHRSGAVHPAGSGHRRRRNVPAMTAPRGRRLLC